MTRTDRRPAADSRHRVRSLALGAGGLCLAFTIGFGTVRAVSSSTTGFPADRIEGVDVDPQHVDQSLLHYETVADDTYTVATKRVLCTTQADDTRYDVEIENTSASDVTLILGLTIENEDDLEVDVEKFVQFVVPPGEFTGTTTLDYRSDRREGSCGTVTFAASTAGSTVPVRFPTGISGDID